MSLFELPRQWRDYFLPFCQCSLQCFYVDILAFPNSSPPNHPPTLPPPPSPTPAPRYPPPMNDINHSNNAPAPAGDTAPLQRPAAHHPSAPQEARRPARQPERPQAWRLLRSQPRRTRGGGPPQHPPVLEPLAAHRRHAQRRLRPPRAPAAPDPRPQRRHRPPRHGESREKAPPPPLMGAVQGRIYYMSLVPVSSYLETKHPDRHRAAFERDILRHPE